MMAKAKKFLAVMCGAALLGLTSAAGVGAVQPAAGEADKKMEEIKSGADQQVQQMKDKADQEADKMKADSDKKMEEVKEEGMKKMPDTVK